jgi:hypothetical protein
MNVAVNKVFWLKTTNEPTVYAKTLVTGIFGVVHVARRRMSHNDVDPSPPPYGKKHAINIESHLPLGVLVGAPIVPMGAIKTHYSYTPEKQDIGMSTAGS